MGKIAYTKKKNDKFYSENSRQYATLWGQICSGGVFRCGLLSFLDDEIYNFINKAVVLLPFSNSAPLWNSLTYKNYRKRIKVEDIDFTKLTEEAEDYLLKRIEHQNNMLAFFKEKKFKTLNNNFIFSKSSKLFNQNVETRREFVKKFLRGSNRSFLLFYGSFKEKYFILDLKGNIKGSFFINELKKEETTIYLGIDNDVIEDDVREIVKTIFEKYIDNQYDFLIADNNFEDVLEEKKVKIDYFTFRTLKNSTLDKVLEDFGYFVNV